MKVLYKILMLLLSYSLLTLLLASFSMSSCGNDEAAAGGDSDIDTDTDSDSDTTDPNCPVPVINILDSNIKPLSTVILDGSASKAKHERALTYRWYFKSVPTDSRTLLSPPADPNVQSPLESTSTSEKPNFFLDVVGSYIVCLDVCEVLGKCSNDEECGNTECTEIFVGPTKDIYIQLTWNDSKADLDLHYIRHDAKYNDSTEGAPGGDCYYNNPSPDYCIPMDDLDDPKLEIDDVEGFGPEVISHDRPCDDSYRIWVSYCDLGKNIPVEAKLKVFIEGAKVADLSYELETSNCHWHPGHIEWSGGTGKFVENEGGDYYICNKENPEQ